MNVSIYVSENDDIEVVSDNIPNKNYNMITFMFGKCKVEMYQKEAELIYRTLGQLICADEYKEVI